jgi:hypothetical protein
MPDETAGSVARQVGRFAHTELLKSSARKAVVGPSSETGAGSGIDGTCAGGEAAGVPWARAVVAGPVTAQAIRSSMLSVRLRAIDIPLVLGPAAYR